MKSFFKWLKSLFAKKDVVIVDRLPKEDEIIVNRPSEVKPDTKVDTDVSWDGLFADISHWESKFDASKYTSKIMILKCSEGTSYVDRTFAERKMACQEKGIVVGGYHFYKTNSDPIAQAKHYLASHKDFLMPAIIDYEKTTGQDEADLRKALPDVLKMMEYLEIKTGMKPIFYSYYSLLRSIKPPEKFRRFPLWIARYNLSLGTVPAPWGHKEVFAWQYGDGKNPAPYKNSYEGIGSCDGNIYYKSNDILGLFK